MNKKVIILAALIGSAGWAQAQQVMVAGWDFAQYAGANFNVVTNTPVFVNTLSATYSDYDPTLGAGAESAAFGTMYWDGSFGSTSGVASNPADAVPYSGSLSNNLFPGTGLAFDAHTVLDAEGFAFSNFLSLKVNNTFGGGDGDLVFAATTPWIHQDWELSFSGVIDESTGTGNVSVGILFSADGTTYNPVGTATITSTDSLFTFQVPATPSTNGYFKFDFLDLETTGNPVLDNVSISAVPEPATIALFMGVLAMGFVVRRRRNR
jgi:hypothetical protein